MITVLGDDRPGLVEALARVVGEHGGSWERSHMSRLGGKFAGIVEIAVADADRAALTRHLTDFGDGPLSVTVELADPAAPGTGSDSCRYSVHLLGADRPGIVHEVSSVIAAHGATIIDLETETMSAPMAGDQLFAARVTVEMAGANERDSMVRALEGLANELMVDIEVSTG